MKEELRSRALMFGVARKELKDIQSLAVLAGPTFMYTFLSCALLLAIKFTLSATVLDRNDGMPYSDELKAFGFFLTLCPRNLIANLYAKKKFWFNPHVDHLLVLGPIIMLGPLVWIFSTISFVKATYCLFLGASILPICGSPFIYWIEGDRLFARLKLWVSQYAAIWMVFVLNMFAGLVFLELSRSATETQGLRSLKGMGKTVFGFGIGFPILRYFSLQASRRGLKMYQVTEPANAEEENNVKKIIFTFIASQEIFWNTLSKLLVAEVRDNATFSICVVCAHIVALSTRFLSAASFKNMQLRKRLQTASAPEDFPVGCSKDAISITRNAEEESGISFDAKAKPDRNENDLPRFKPMDDSSALSNRTILTLSFVERTIESEKKHDSTIIVEQLLSQSGASSSTAVFVPMSKETAFAFSNLASFYAEWCGRGSAFMLTLLFTSTEPQLTWTRCRDQISVETHLIRVIIVFFGSIFADAAGFMIDSGVAGAKLSEAVKELKKIQLSGFVYLQMALMTCSLCGMFIMAMPGILENGNACFKEGRKARS